MENGIPSVVQFPSVDSAQRASSAASTRSKVALQPGHSLMDWIRLGNSDVDLAGVGGKLLSITEEELAKHNKPNDAWLALKGKVYNVSKYLDYHPGGEDELFKGVGIDATDLFNQVHRWINFESMLKKCLVGKLESPEPKNSFKGKRNGLSSSKNSLSVPITLTPPQASPQTSRNSTPSPRYDWFQNQDIVSLIIYTKCKFINQSSCIVSLRDEVTFNLGIRLLDRVYIIHIELENKILPTYDVKISQESGAIEIMLKKLNSSIHWSHLGIPLPSHESFTYIKDQELNYFSCCLLNKEQITHDTYLFTFKLPGGCKMTIPIGHHVCLKGQYEGCEISRNYTAVIPEIDAPGHDISEAIYLMIKIYPDGAFTPILNTIVIGDYIDISEYNGNFDDQSLKTCSSIYILAAGTGFTPMVKIINYCLFIASSNCRMVSLLFFNKTAEDILWRKQLSRLQLEFPEKFQVKHVLSSPDDTWEGPKGRISRKLLIESFSSSIDKANDLILICGPKGFTETAVNLTKGLEYTEENIHVFQG